MTITFQGPSNADTRPTKPETLNNFPSRPGQSKRQQQLREAQQFRVSDARPMSYDTNIAKRQM